MTRLALALVLLLASGHLLAWNAGGHRLVAAVAWRQMSEGARTEAGRLLAAHPDHVSWQTRNHHEDKAYAAFLESSTWADDIRRDARFHDDDEAATSLLAGFPDMARRRHWHFVDQPVFARPPARPGGGEIDRQLLRLSQIVANGSGSGASRAHALVWLIHLVGDIHQPLHTASRFDGDGRGDDGGNALWIDNPFHPRRREMTLHAYWDDLAGPPWLRGPRLEAAADRLPVPERAAIAAESVRIWLEEGRRLAEQIVYAGLDGEVPSLSEAYHERAQKTARAQVALAGWRLARLLERLLERK